MADYPATGSFDWAAPLKAYIDEEDDDDIAALQADVDTRKQRIAYSEDTANTAIALGAGVFTALAPTFSVPPSADDVTLRWGYVLQITTAGNGSVTIAPADVTSGSAPTALPTQGTVAGTFVAGTFSSAPGESGEFNFGPSATWRTFRLYGFVGRDAASSLAASMRASGVSPFFGKTSMEAILG